MKNIALYPNSFKDGGLSCTKDLIGRLSARGCSMYIDPEFEDQLNDVKDELKKYLVFMPFAEAVRLVSAVIVIGGDGTILNAAKYASPVGVPLLGLNLGRIGFLAELDYGEIGMLDKLFTGEYRIEERMMLDVALDSPNGHFSKCALNDAVVFGGSLSRISELELYEGGEYITSYRADGIIISTPTGSTAYSLAAGGSVIDPKLRCICVTPICAHSLVSRPLVFSPDAKIAVKSVNKREGAIYLTVDGGDNTELLCGDAVRISSSLETTKLIRLKGQSFYNILRHKMDERDHSVVN